MAIVTNLAFTPRAQPRHRRHLALHPWLWLLSCVAPLLACSEEPPAVSSDVNFVIDEPLEVSIEVDEDDWDTLRNEGRGLALTLSGCSDLVDYAYTEVPAHITIEGQRIEDVVIRKKGLLGSLSSHRPSLRVELSDPPHADRQYRGLSRLTLNNNLQDPTNAHQCVTYALFEQAGIAAPRCGLARVSVNGEELPTYTHVEPVKKAFLERVFGDDSGNLYESVAASEFTPERVEYFQLKTNEMQDDRSDLDRVVQALQADDDALTDALSEVFDLDELITFWAMEVLTGHADGLTGNRNNTFLYHHPGDDRFHPIPWGTDGAFAAAAVGGGEHLRSVFATSLISSRMYGVPSLRARFHTRLRELLDTVWDEDAIEMQIDQIVAAGGGVAIKVDEMKTFVREQREAIETELALNDGQGPDVSPPNITDLSQCIQPPSASGQINHNWDETLAMTNPSPVFAAPEDGIELHIPLGDDEQELALITSTVLQSVSRDAAGKLQIGMYGLDQESMRPIYFGIIGDVASYEVGTFNFHGFETFGVVLALDTNEVLGLIGDGTITLDEVGSEMGDPVRGSWQGLIAPLRAAP